MLQDSHLGIFDVLVGIVVFQYLLIATFLFGRRNRDGRSQPGNAYLAIFFCLVAINFIDGELMRQGFYYHVPNLALLEDCFALTYGPLLYFYTQSIVSPERKRSSRDVVHFVPALLVLLLTLAFYTIRNEENKKLIIDAIVSQKLPVVIGLFSFSLVFIHFFTYLILSIRRVNAYHRTEDSVNVSWLSFTLKVLAVTFIISWGVTFFSILQKQTMAEIGLIAVVLILLYYINKLVLKALKDPGLFAAVDTPSLQTRKVSRQALEPTEISEIKSKLDTAMTQSRMYSEADLTLEKLSEHTGIPGRRLSQYLNEILNLTFFDYVNGLRIEEAKSIFRASKDPKLTIQEVMYKVGFNSKSSFNTLFREKTGQTPSDFRKSGSES